MSHKFKVGDFIVGANSNNNGSVYQVIGVKKQPDPYSYYVLSGMFGVIEPLVANVDATYTLHLDKMFKKQLKELLG